MVSDALTLHFWYIANEIVGSPRTCILATIVFIMSTPILLMSETPSAVAIALVTNVANV